MLTFRRETWEQFARDFWPIWEGVHKAESALPEYPPHASFDVARYVALDAQGMLHIWTGRDAERRLQGYIVSLLTTHLHYTPWNVAMPTLYFLQHAWRGQGWGSQLFRSAEHDLWAQGVGCVMIGARTTLPHQPQLEHLGYRPVEMLLLKTLTKEE